MQLKEMVLAILNESELLLSDDAVEQIVDQVQCFNRNRYFHLVHTTCCLVHTMSTTKLKAL